MRATEDGLAVTSTLKSAVLGSDKDAVVAIDISPHETLVAVAFAVCTLPVGSQLLTLSITSELLIFTVQHHYSSDIKHCIF